MANKVLLKKSSVIGKVPLTTDLDYGEIALNYADEKLYFKNTSDQIKFITNYTLPTASNSTLGGVKVDGTTITINGSGVISSTGGGSSQTYSRTTVTATAGQTTFTATYTVGLVIVYLNGILLDSSSYTASNGTSIVLTDACVVDDVIEIISFAAGQQISQSTSLKVSSVVYPGSATAADPAGGETIVINGTGFSATPTVFIDNVIVPSVTFVSSTQISFVTPSKTAATYHIYVVNPDGSTCIKVNGLSYSGTPAWTTPAGDLGSSTGVISIQLQATGDAPLVYSLTSGSTLPAGVTLSSTGLLSGTVASEQVFNFSITVTDAQNQTTPRSFSVTVVVSDPYFKYNTLLLSGDGVNAAQNNTFLDSSTNNFTITRNGNVTQGSFNPYGNNWSTYFDGSSYLNLSSALNLSDFTFECWVYPTSISSEGSGLLVQFTGTSSVNWDHSWIMINPTGTLEMGRYQAQYYYYFTTSNPVITLNTWTHIAITKVSSSVNIFINGVSVATTLTGSIGAAGITHYNGTNPITIGYWANYSGATNRYFYGNISNLRIVKGSALYTSNFTPPTTPLTAVANTAILTCQSNQFIDKSTNNYAITVSGTPRIQRFSPFAPTAAYSAATYGGSAYFDGTGDYLSVADNAALEAGTNDFTLEGWFYATGGSSNVDNIIVAKCSSAYAPYFVVHKGTAGKIAFCSSSTNLSWNIANNLIFGNVSLNTWNHFAISRSSNLLYCFLNGVRGLTIDVSTIALHNNSDPFTIGSQYQGANPFYGYVSDVRLINGTAVYTANFTPPTAPLTAITNTSLLAKFTNAGIYDSVMMNDLETVGNAQISTSVKKYGTGSMYFDGTSGSVIRSSGTNNNLQLGNGNFTIECWVYFNNITGAAQIVNTATNTTNTSYALYRSGTSLYFYLSSTGTTWDIASGLTIGTVSANTWYHVALVRSGSTFTSYLNGVAGAMVTNTNTLFSSTGVGFGNDASGTSVDVLNGYIDDLRITKGIARYTANFTPPTAALPGR